MRTLLSFALGILIAAFVAACGGNGGSTASAPGSPDPGSANCEGASFPSTFAAIEKLIFEKHGCTEAVCHGSSAQGGLDLSPGVAYGNLIEVPSTSSAQPRVLPGDNDRSYLWLKVAAKTKPGSVEIAGAPMPNGLPALAEDELELLRLWIYGGAPESGTVPGTEALIDACLPPPEPITIKPLAPPAAGEGVQLAMPPWNLPSGSEHEVCFASYYDVTDQVPEKYRDPTGTMLRFARHELRQDPQSHHLILNLATNLTTADLHHPAFGAWTCKGGQRDGEACEPTDLEFCGDGLCASEPQPTFACVGFGAKPGAPGSGYQAIGGAQQAQAEIALYDGVFAQIPLKGILYWNSHAFNLTNRDHAMNGRLNYYFADDQRYPLRPIFNVERIFSADALPYTTQTICNDHVLPQGARLFELSSHTHKHGKHFTVDLRDGSRIYESFVYNDPVYQRFDPPLAFDSPDAAERTLRYCSLYNNGVADDGSPDPGTVTRASRVPESAAATFGSCRPIACTAGNIGAACDGEEDDTACDSAASAGDGECDACRITGGESTENEMFILIGQYFLERAEAPDDPINLIPGFGSPAGVRSTFTGLALPPQMGCATSHAGHTGHDTQHAGR